jgi:hypothetical protein
MSNKEQKNIEQGTEELRILNKEQEMSNYEVGHLNFHDSRFPFAVRYS